MFLGGAALLTGFYLTLDKLKDTLEGQLADRLTQAVDQLRDRNLEVRLGGIYALERLARTSENDYWPIMEILTAFVRERASVAKIQPLKEPPLRLAPDIQAALDVIGRRRHTYQDGESQRLDLRGTDLRRANLAGAKLAGTILSEVRLEEAHLAGINLEEAILRAAHLEHSNLADAKMQGAFL
ncbi:MAG TPA: pentapeptide repeat-containing protein, partial [Nitrospirales bacterium]|nr:pentapeptide repeat-containing protein [Nitrospirales bacterium]